MSNQEYDEHLTELLSSCSADEKECIEQNNLTTPDVLYSFFYNEDYKKQLMDEYRYYKLTDVYSPIDHSSIKEYLSIFGEEEILKIRQKVKEISDSDKDYRYTSDNWRFAKVGDIESEKLYKLKQSKGCCGFYDEVHEIDGVKYKIGFNYGH